jgi:predicted ABC-class ATPase
MRTLHDLGQHLRRIDGHGYKAYKDLVGSYDGGLFTLFIDYVQGDPFAAPSRVRVRVAQEQAGFPPHLFASRPGRIALEDFLARQVAAAILRRARGVRGSGRSGQIEIDVGGQEVLERTAVQVNASFVEALLSVGLPAAGRSVLGQQAAIMFEEELPRIVEEGLLYSQLEAAAVQRHVEVVEDQEALREQLAEHHLVAFLGDGSILPRESGVSDRPLCRGRVVPLVAPAARRVELSTRHRGKIAGLGIPEGVTLIVGGGYHGKSTLLRALERGVYPHIPGDGREWVVTRSDAVKIRAEDGRRIEHVNISPFINNLPFGVSTTDFSTDDASGSTSQAANIIEAVEAGAKVLLLDEDTSATNFMIRDARMQALVSKSKEPITPFIDKVRSLYTDYGVSTVLVMGGSGDYFEVADTVLLMEEYIPHEVTARAKEIAGNFPTCRRREGGEAFGSWTPRRPQRWSIDASRGRREVKISVKDRHTIVLGRTTIDLHSVEQLVDPSQTRAIGDAIWYAATHYMDGRRTLAEILDALERDLDRQGLAILDPFRRSSPPDYARPRRFEIAAALNRLRTLKVQ